MEGGATGINPPAVSSPWAKIQPPTDPVCLSDIMSEQLANDLQIKEDEKFIDVYEEVNMPIDVFDLSTDISATADCENDEMIALMLQAQFDKEHDDMIKKTENKFNGKSKVCISYSNFRVTPDTHLLDEDSDCGDANDEKHRELDSFVSTEKQFKSIPKCGYKKEGDHIVTKHDIPMSNRRNACRVMNFPPEFQTGDGGGFDMKLSNRVFNSLKAHSRSEQTRRNRAHDKSERATKEMGVDPRTRLILFKLLNQEVLDQINGILSTGKESIVMHADGGSGNEIVVPKECAIKIFKTTLNEFKTRDKYIQDDFRFKDRFSKQNPRKIIHMWAEKEMHNLNRMQRANISCPEVVCLKKHILVMSFIGENHKPAPKIKEAALSFADLNDAFEDVVNTMKRLYSDAGLVHGDLSEYNILWHNSKCWYIDVSQAVEKSHPLAFEFLLRDCQNVCSFFQKKGVPSVMSPNVLFNQITGFEVPNDGIATLCQIQDFEKNNELLTYQKSEKKYPFDYCWSQTETQKE
ncbi:Serine/threonine-protein kinase RIO3 [Gryllus bimaculatus]|nr:Serine/threonine-protein kinase RIO3 [Gryllus bimaculatus]